MTEIIDFTQDKKSFSLQLASESYLLEISAKFVSFVPEVINLNELNDLEDVGLVQKISPSVHQITVFLSNVAEPKLHEYSIVLAWESVFGFQYVEIVRQSEDFLQDRFSFSRPGGYCILGRRNFQLGQSAKIQNLAPQVFWGGASYSSHENSRELETRHYHATDYDEVVLARGILSWLVSQSINTGPYGTNHRKYSLANFSMKLRMLATGKYAVQCSGFRDLFVHVAVSAGLKVRSIDANNYAPEVPDLITYGHSLSELYISKLDRYVLFDPWFAGLMVVDGGGVPLRVEDIQLADTRSVNLLFLLNQINRLVIDGTGKQMINRFQSVDLKFTTYFFHRDFGCCMPGYREYFRHISRRDVVVRTRFGINTNLLLNASSIIARRVYRMFQLKKV